MRFRADLAERLETEQETRHADGDTGRRHLLAGEALDETVIASAADDGAKADRLAGSSFIGDVNSASNTGPV